MGQKCFMGVSYMYKPIPVPAGRTGPRRAQSPARRTGTARDQDGWFPPAFPW